MSRSKRWGQSNFAVAFPWQSKLYQWVCKIFNDTDQFNQPAKDLIEPVGLQFQFFSFIPNGQGLL